MKAEHLVQAMGDLDDSLIAEYDAYQAVKRRKWLRPAITAACICLLAGTGWGIINGNIRIGGSGAGGSGHEESSTFMHYEGPVLPLTLMEENGDVTAEREITFDFSSYSIPYDYNEIDGKEIPYYRTGCTVADAYTLYNASDEELTLTALYPFTGTIRDLYAESYSVSVNGTEIETEILSGGYAGRPEEFAEYEQLLEGEEYQAQALSDIPVFDQTIIAYDFTENTAPEEYNAATQSISFNIDPDATRIMFFGFNGCEYQEDGFRRYSFFVPQNERNEIKRLAVLGEDIANYTIQGYKNGACEAGNELADVHSTVIRTEMTLEKMLNDVIRQVAETYWTETYWNGEMTKQQSQMLLRGVKEMILDAGALSDSPRYDYEMLDDVITEAYSQQRVFYAEIPVTIPAGGSAQIDISLWRGGSYDYACSQKHTGVKGYDLATSLGSSLSITSQQASLANTGNIELVRQNFGFDLSGGILSVSLGEEKQYYMEVKRLTKDAKG